MTLKTLETKWSAYLSGENCPPVLGLVALSEVESEEIRVLIAEKLEQSLNPPWQTLFTLTQEFPACLSVWLARKAGEAYESGAFWDNFGALIGVVIPITQRDEFTKQFRRACRKSMLTWVPPNEVGGHYLVAEFLYQAGLPLDRCKIFAQHVRKVERCLGLPDADTTDAGEQLRGDVLDSLQSIPVPTLKRALHGPAGPSICELALNVILKSEFTNINPRLGQELELEFGRDGQLGTLRRSFLRLGEDLCSLEIVGPRQDPNLITSSGLTWWADSKKFPTPQTEEFLLNVTNSPRVTLELDGLSLGTRNRPDHKFVLQLNDLEKPFILFDERTRRQRCADGSLPIGRYYWLLHRISDNLVGAKQRYDWSDGKRALSLFRMSPGNTVELKSESGGPWHFTATRTPFFDAGGEVLRETTEPIYFGWSEIPFVWLPVEETDQEWLTQWLVYLRDGNVEHTWKLTRSNKENGNMVKCCVEFGDFLFATSPGLHHFELTLRRNKHTRAEAKTDYWYWKGLVRYDTEGFHLNAPPENLIHGECRGFHFGDTTIRHLSDQNRLHKLTFNVDGESVAFNSSQPGVFLESLERHPGQQAVPCSHHLGEAFSVSFNSERWLKIWLAGQSDWEIKVAGRIWQRNIGGDQRKFVELSLATLATAFPNGGEILLRLVERELLIAKFTRPLQPVNIYAVGNETHKVFRFHFSEAITWVRPVLRELASGQQRVLDGQQFDSVGHCIFFTADLPQIECSNLADENLPTADLDHPVTMHVPKHGWPEGLWFIELEVRRDEHAEWEPVALHGNERAPLVMLARNELPLTTTRARLFWASVVLEVPLPNVPLSDFPFDETGRAELFELLSELIALRQSGIAPAARQDMRWLKLKDTVRLLSQLAGRVARQAGGDGFQTKLLNLACQDPNHAGFVYLPNLLSLPAGEYRELPTGDPLNNALRLCGRIAAANSVVKAVQDDPDFIDLSVINHFANFVEFAAAPSTDSYEDFNDFNYEDYWQRVLGTPQYDNLVPDWSWKSPVLGKEHFVWSLSELIRRYENPAGGLDLGAANALLHCSPRFCVWLHHRLAGKAVMSTTAWNNPWPCFVAPEADFLETIPHFASLFALTARAAAAGWIEFDEVLAWFKQQVEHRYMVEEGIAALVGLAPELFGHQLIFWELMVKTVAHASEESAP